MLLCAACVSADTAGLLTYQKSFVALILLEAILKYVLPDKIKWNLWISKTWNLEEEQVGKLYLWQHQGPLTQRITAVIHISWDSGVQGLDFSYADVANLWTKESGVRGEKEINESWFHWKIKGIYRKPVTELAWAYNRNSCSNGLWSTIMFTHCTGVGFFLFAAGLPFSLVCARRGGNTVSGGKKQETISYMCI